MRTREVLAIATRRSGAVVVELAEMSRTTPLLLAASVTLAALSCGKKQDAPASSGVPSGATSVVPPSAPASSSGASAYGGGPSGPLVGTFEGRSVVLRYGKAFPRLGALHVVLSSAPTSCASSTGAGDDDAFDVELDVPPGPSASFFSGKTIGVQAWFHDRRTLLKQEYARPYQTRLSLAPFTLGRDARLRGSFELKTVYAETGQAGAKVTYDYVASGDIDAEICASPGGFGEAVGATDEGDLDRNAAGTIGGKPFEPQGAIATVYVDPYSGESYLYALSFYPVKVTCATRFAIENGNPAFAFKSIGGTGNTRRLLGPQPADAYLSIPEIAKGAAKSAAVTHALGRRAWIDLDHLDYTPGGTVSGKVFAASTDDAHPESSGRIGGVFRAIVCTS